MENRGKVVGTNSYSRQTFGPPTLSHHYRPNALKYKEAFQFATPPPHLFVPFSGIFSSIAPDGLFLVRLSYHSLRCF